MKIRIECEQFTLLDIARLGKWMRNELPDHYHVEMFTDGGDIPLEEAKKILESVWENDPYNVVIIRKEETNGS